MAVWNTWTFYGVQQTQRRARYGNTEINKPSQEGVTLRESGESELMGEQGLDRRRLHAACSVIARHQRVF
jgi:hypothetical protein